MSVARLQQVLEWPLAFLALLVIPALLVEERAASPGLRASAIAVNWAVWIAFCLDFVLSWANERHWLRSHSVEARLDEIERKLDLLLADRGGASRSRQTVGSAAIETGSGGRT